MVVHSEITKNGYIAILKRLRKQLGVADGLAFLEDSTKIIRHINELDNSDNTKRSYYSCLKSVLRDANLYPDAQKAYNVPFVKLAKEAQELSNKQLLSPTEKAKYMPWKDILALKPKFIPSGDDEDKFRAWQEYVIYCLYTMMPPMRADWSPMKVFDKKPKEDKGNYLILRKKNSIVVLNEYKTHAKHGRMEFKIPSSLYDVLVYWRTLNPSEWLLLKREGEPMTSGNLSQFMPRMFLRHCDKGITINTLRHSYITYMRAGKEMTLLQKDAFAKTMMHTAIGNELYKRVDGGESTSDEE